MRVSIVALTLIASLSVPALAKPSLRDVSVVEGGLFTISVADKIRRECGSISGRIFKARGKLKAMYAKAREMGYSEAEIEQYVNADAEKKRMRAKRDAYLRTQGVVKSDPATYCAAGRAEIGKSSQIGALLKAR